MRMNAFLNLARRQLDLAEAAAGLTPDDPGPVVTRADLLLCVQLSRRGHVGALRRLRQFTLETRGRVEFAAAGGYTQATV